MSEVPLYRISRTGPGERALSRSSSPELRPANRALTMHSGLASFSVQSFDRSRLGLVPSLGGLERFPGNPGSVAAEWSVARSERGFE